MCRQRLTAMDTEKLITKLKSAGSFYSKAKRRCRLNNPLAAGSRINVRITFSNEERQHIIELLEKEQQEHQRSQH